MWKHYIVEIDIHFYFLIWRYCSCHCPYFLYIFLKIAFRSIIYIHYPVLVTHFKSIIQIILGCSQDCAIITIINLRAFSFPQEHPTAISDHSSFLLRLPEGKQEVCWKPRLGWCEEGAMGRAIWAAYSAWKRQRN